jgi:hypothetical protein
MAEIVIRTQAEFDALPESFEEYTYILIQNDPNAGRIIIRRNRDNASVVARGNASVWAYDNASVGAYDNASVQAYDNASVEAQDNASVWARGNASVWARGNASVQAWDNSSVSAWDNSSVSAYDNASVEARGNASVEARDNASVVARGNASVEARDNASVVAWDNASVVARGNASVVAHNQAAIRRYSAESKITLHDSSVCWDMLSIPANISSFAKFSKHTNPVAADAAATKITDPDRMANLLKAKLTKDEFLALQEMLDSGGGLEDTITNIAVELAPERFVDPNDFDFGDEVKE